jgi:hypothetical protein
VGRSHLEFLLGRSAEDSLHSARKEAERQGWSLDRLTEFQVRYLHKYAMLQEATWAAERQLLYEFVRAGDRVDEVFRERRPESLALRERLNQAKP